MARMFLIIDGYNLMHAAGFARSSYGPGDLERSRNRLLKQLTAQLDDSAAGNAIVVFDGKQSSNDTPQETISVISVRFSQDGMDADSEIELLLNSHSSPRQVLVVSSDHRLHKAARRRRSQCMDSEDFWKLLQSGDGTWTSPKSRGVQNAGDSGSRKPGADAGHSESDYAQDFLKIDVTEINRSVRREDR